MTTEVLFTSVFVFRIHKGRAGHFRKFSSLNVILKSQKPRATKIEKTKTNPMKERKKPEDQRARVTGKKPAEEVCSATRQDVTCQYAIRHL